MTDIFGGSLHENTLPPIGKKMQKYHRASLLYKTILGFVLFFSIYSIYFNYLPTYTSRIIGIISIIFLLYYITFNKFPMYNQEIIILICFYIIYIIYLLILSYIYEDDYMFAYSRVMILLQIFPSSIFISILLLNKNISFRDTIKIISICIIIQSLFVILDFLSADFRNFTIKYIPQTGNTDYTITQARFRGLTNSGEATLSVTQSIGVISLLYLIVTSKSINFKYYILYSLSLGIVTASIFLSGRTGFLIFPVTFLFIISMNSKWRQMKRGFILLFFAAPIFIFMTYTLLTTAYTLTGGAELTSGEDVLNRLLRWYTEEFFSDSGSIQSYTVLALISHWFFPQELSVLIFGDPSTWSLNRIPSDVGFIRILHANGLVGSLMFYGLILFILVSSLSKINDPISRRYIFFIFLFLFIIESKEPFLSKFEISTIIFTIYFYLTISSQRDFSR